MTPSKIYQFDFRNLKFFIKAEYLGANVELFPKSELQISFRKSSSIFIILVYYVHLDKRPNHFI